MGFEGLSDSTTLHSGLKHLQSIFTALRYHHSGNQSTLPLSNHEINTVANF